MAKNHVRKLTSAVMLGAVLVLLGGCENVPSLPQLTNRPSPVNPAPKQRPPSVQKVQPVLPTIAKTPNMAKVNPIRPRLQTGLQQTARLNPGQRPPALPSLKDLLGRMPRTDDGGLNEPPPVPVVRGRRVAILVPLSGPNSMVGNALLSAAQMALFAFADPNFEILVQDTKGTVDGASDAARLAVADGASLIVGPLLSSSVRGVSAIARAASVPVIAFSSDRTVVGDGVYTMGFFPGDEVRRVVAYAFLKGARRFGLLAPQNLYGETVFKALEETVAKFGGEVSRTQFYAPSAQEFSEPVKRLANYDERRRDLLNQRKTLTERGDEVSLLALKRLENLQTIGAAPFDALLVADGGKRLVAVAAMLPFYDIDPNKVMILGTGQWDVKGLGTEPALVGGLYPAPDPSQRQDFSNKYMDVYGKRPHRLATLAYDAMALAIVLGAQDGTDIYGQATLTKPEGFMGRDGIFRFHNDGTVERGLAVMKIGRGVSKVVDPAPQAFVN